MIRFVEGLGTLAVRLFIGFLILLIVILLIAAVVGALS